MAAESAKLNMSNFNYFYAFIIFSLCLVCSNKASEIQRPRGVSISKASLYIPDKDFTCFDGSNTIPFNQVNDDYCDCSDGSDEPGTAACPNSFFHCTNAGYRPLNIPSSQVNDGICDCCDGADEYAGKRHCENTCHELGKAERVEAQRRAEIAKAGNEARLEASKKGKALKLEKKEKLEQLEKDKQEAESLKQEKERLKLEAEELEKSALEQYKKVEQEERQARYDEEKEENEREAEQVFKLLDSNEDNKIDVSELLPRKTFDQNRDGEVSESEALFFLDNNADVDYVTFLETVFPKMKPFLMMEKGLFKPPEAEKEGGRDENDVGVGTVEDVTGEYHEERRETDDEEELEGGEEAEEEEEEEEEEEVAEELKEPELSSPSTQYDPETQNLIDVAKAARSEFEEADRSVRDIQREMTNLQEYLEKDFGPEEEFAPLEGECFEFTDREYTYKLCPFDQASQRPRSGGAETRLGIWKQWSGPAEDKYSSMMYDKGQACWNGPQRSTQVEVACGIENALVAVSEPNKCEYLFQFTTPSACRVTDTDDNRNHDEL